MISSRLFLAGLLGLSALCASGEPARADAPAATDTVAPSVADKASAARGEAAIAAAQGTPGQEAANFLSHSWPHEQLLQLKGEKPATAAQLANDHGTVDWLTKMAESGPSWPRPAKMSVPFAKKAPKIDGILNDAAWKGAVTFEGEYPFNSSTKTMAPGTKWYVTWDKQYLYFAFDCADGYVVSPDTQRDASIFNHDCVEMFILPEFRQGVYWELVVSPTGTVFDALHEKLFDNWGASSRVGESIQGLKVATHIDGTANNNADVDHGYTVEVAVPFTELPSYTRGNSPRTGEMLNLMLARLDENQGPMQPYSFNPLLSWGHNIWNPALAELVK